MRTYSLYTTDTRYKAPTLTLLTAEDEASAIAMANDSLAGSEFHTAVELRDGEKRIYQRFKSLRDALYDPYARQ